MKMPSSIKAFLQTEEVGNEIRRFAADHTTVANFKTLKVKLASVYPSLTNDHFSIFWKDEEGDEIIISSDEELRYAIGIHKSDIMKIYLRVKKPSTGSQTEAKPTSKGSGYLHVNVVCDGCNGKVQGFRYKCLQCHDFDLCSVCESNGLHAEHSMMRLSTALSEMRVHQLLRFMNRANRGCPRRGAAGGFSSTPKNDAGPDGQNSQQEFNPHNLLSKIWSALGGPHPDTEAQAGARESSQDFLRTIGESVAAALDPFGIDVKVDVETNGKTERCAPPKEKTAAASAANGNTQADNKNNPIGKEEPKAEQNNPQNANKQQQVDVEVKNAATAMTEQEQETEFAAMAGLNMIPSMIPKEMEAKFLQTLQSLPPHLQPWTISDTGDWTYVDIPNPEENVEATSAAANEKQLAQPASQQEESGNPAAEVKADGVPAMEQQSSDEASGSQEEAQNEEPLHKDPRIAKVLKQMMAMGFSNEGGWLSHLLELKGGDISRVLDVLQPVSKSG